MREACVVKRRTSMVSALLVTAPYCEKLVFVKQRTRMISVLLPIPGLTFLARKAGAQEPMCRITAPYFEPKLEQPYWSFGYDAKVMRIPREVEYNCFTYFCERLNGTAPDSAVYSSTFGHSTMRQSRYPTDRHCVELPETKKDTTYIVNSQNTDTKTQ